MLDEMGLERLPSLEAALGYGLAAQHAQSEPTTGIIDAVQLFVGATREDPQVTRAVLSVMNLGEFYSAVGLPSDFFPDLPESVLESGIEAEAFSAIETYASDQAQSGGAKSAAPAASVFGSRELAVAILLSPPSGLGAVLDKAGVASTELAKAIDSLGPSPQETGHKAADAEAEQPAGPALIDTDALVGHTDRLGFVAITPDGRHAITTSTERTARIWDLTTGETTHVLEGHTDEVWFVAITPDGRHAITTSLDHTARIWDLETGRGVSRIADWAPPQRARSDQIDIVHDEPATRAEEDRLNRYALAQLVAAYIRRFRDTEPRTSFLLHIDGPWGSGKSTLLRFLERQLRSDHDPAWVVVSLDAWRESKLNSPAFSLLGALRKEVMATNQGVSRVGFFFKERWRVLGKVNKLAMLVSLLVAGVLAFLLLQLDSVLDDASRWLGLTAGLLSVAAVVWSASRGAARVVAWDTPTGLATLMQRERDPMAAVADQFQWLLREADRPILFLIDDLDRCDHGFVVELLDSVQTLMRDAPTDSHRRMRGIEQIAESEPTKDAGDGTDTTDTTRGLGKAFVFVVAADGRWIRQSYEVTHSEFIEAVAQPGQPLGYLFLDKLFQLTVPVPALSPARQAKFLASVLKTREGTVASAAEEPPPSSTDDLRQALGRSSTEGEVVETLGKATPQQRLELAPDAITKLTEREVQTDTEHVLRPFAQLLAPNPRSIKRFVMDYAAVRGARTAEGSSVSVEKLALWTVVRTRWPALADYLRAHPRQVSDIGKAEDQLEHVPEDLRPLFIDENGDVLAVLDFNHGTFTDDDIRAATGTYDLGG